MMGSLTSLLGTPALTSRGFVEVDFAKVAEFFDAAVKLALKIKADANGCYFCHFSHFTFTLCLSCLTCPSVPILITMVSYECMLILITKPFVAIIRNQVEGLCGIYEVRHSSICTIKATT